MVAKRIIKLIVTRILLPLLGGVFIVIYWLSSKSTLISIEDEPSLDETKLFSAIKEEFPLLAPSPSLPLATQQANTNDIEPEISFDTHVDERDTPATFPSVPMVSSIANSSSSLPSTPGSWQCRHRSTKWLGQNSFYVPPDLTHAFERYNRLHDRLLRELPIETAFTISLTSPQNEVRYVVWRPVGEDLAGRLLSLVSTYLIALLTDRVLLVNFPHVRSILCEPFTRSSWIIPTRVLPWLNRFIKIEDAMEVRRPVRIARLRLKPGFQEDDSIYLTCNGNLKGKLGHIQILLVESPIGFVELLLRNPSHRERLLQWMGTTSTSPTVGGETALYPALLHQLVHPANDLWFRLVQTYHRHFTSSNYDRYTRLAIQGIEKKQIKGDELKSPLIEQLRCATQQISRERTTRNLFLYYAPMRRSSSLMQLKKARNVLTKSLDIYSTIRLATSAEELFKAGELGDWRRLFTDIWMISWSTTFIMMEGTSQAALLAHYYRNKDSLLVINDTEGGEEIKLNDERNSCRHQKLMPYHLGSIPDSLMDCTTFRQVRRERRQVKEYNQPGAIILNKESL